MLVAAEVLYVTEHVPLGVLRQGNAEMSAEAEVDDRRFLDRIALDGQAGQQDEAAAPQHLVADAVEHRAQCRQGEGLAVDVDDAETARVHGLHRRVELSEFGRGERADPLARRVHLRAVPDGGSGDLAWRHRGVESFLYGGHREALSSTDLGLIHRFRAY